jgi:hypothetical protein
MEVGDLVKYSHWRGHIVVGIIVEEADPLLTTPVYNIQRVKASYSGNLIREHVMRGDILEVISASR